MPTTRGAAKRAQAGSSAAAAEGSKRAKRGEKPAQAGPSEPKKAAKPALTEAQRKHKSRQLETNEVYEKKDWDEVVEQVETKFRRNPNLGRLELSFNFHVRKWAAKIPKDVAKKHLAPLTQLTRLSFGGYYMADADPLPAGAALPHLKIAGMGEANLCMETLGPFMPNVEQLRAQRIQIHLQPVAHGAASSSSGSGGSYHPGVCKALTHLSCQHLWVYGPSSKEATGAAVAAAFPALRVITQAPTVTGFPDERTFSMNSVRTSRSGSTMYITPAMRSERYFIYDYPRYLKHLKALSVSGTDGALYDRYSAKDLGSARSLARTDWGYKPLAGVTSLRVLWIKEIKKSDLPFACEVSSLQQLTQLCFTLSKPVITADVHKLLQSLLHLTKLSTLAMPIHLLCTEGCAAGVSTATVSSTLGQIAALPSLKHLMLLDDHHESPRWSTDWDEYGKEPAEGQPQKCNHRASWLEAIPKLTPAAAAAAGSSTASSKGLEVLLVDTNGDFTSDSEYDWGHPLWGVFGPPDQYFTKLEW